MRIAAEAICQHYSLKPKRIIEASGLAAALGLVGGNKGVTFVCRSTIENIRPETPIIYFSCGSMENFTSVFAVFKKQIKILPFRIFSSALQMPVLCLFRLIKAGNRHLFLLFFFMKRFPWNSGYSTNKNCSQNNHSSCNRQGSRSFSAKQKYPYRIHDRIYDRK